MGDEQWPVGDVQEWAWMDNRGVYRKARLTRRPVCVTHRELIVHTAAKEPYCARMEWAGDCDIREIWMEVI